MFFFPQIHVHGNNLSSLHKHLPPRLLPAQLGGERGEYNAQSWTDTVLEGKTKMGEMTRSGSNILNSGTVKNEVEEKIETKESKIENEKENTNEEDVKVENTDSKERPEDDKEEVEEDDDPEPDLNAINILKGFKLENLIRPNTTKFQLAQMTEDSEGVTLKKINKSRSIESPSYSPTSKDSSIFNFAKSKSFSFSKQSESDGSEEAESVYNFPKPKTPPSFKTSFANSFTANMNKIGITMRSKESFAAYDKGQPSDHMLLSNEAVTLN